MAFDAISSSTLQKYAPKLADNVFRNNPLLEALLRSGHVKFQDGRTIVLPVMTGANDTVVSYAGYNPILLTPQSGISAAEFPWRQVGGSVTISGIEEAQNSGSSRVFDLLKAKTTQLERSFKAAVATQMMTDGTGNTNQDIQGLAAAISATSTYGGLDVATYPVWKSIVTATAGALTLTMIDHSFNLASDDNGETSPNFEVTTMALWEKYNNLLVPNQRFTDPKTAEAGFRNITHQGVPVVWDRMVPTGTWYQLNLEHIWFFGHKEHWFTTTPFVARTVNGIDARVALMSFYGNLAVDERRRHAVITGIT